MKIKNCHPKIEDGIDLRLFPQVGQGGLEPVGGRWEDSDLGAFLFVGFLTRVDIFKDSIK